MDRQTERAREVEAAIRDIRDIETRQGVNRDSLEAIKARLMRLATRVDLFRPEDFPPPEGENMNSALYRLYEDDEHRFALYANSTSGRRASPAHNHTTWAVIVGVSGGDELNRFYERTADGGIRETGQTVVRAGTGVAFLPDDIHSIHIEAPVLNFHLYGKGLEQLTRREYYKPARNEWAVFPPHANIREARAGRA